MIFLHHFQSIKHSGTALNGHRIVNHAVFGTLYGMNLSSLLVNAHILVDHADTTLTRYGYGKGSFCHGIHGGRHQRNIESDVSGKLGPEIYISRKNFGIGRDQQDIIECQTVHFHFFSNKRHKTI